MRLTPQNIFKIGAADDRKWAESDPVLYESPPHGEYNEPFFSFWYLLVEPDTCDEVHQNLRVKYVLIIKILNELS